MKKSLFLFVLALGLLSSLFAQSSAEESSIMTADQIINNYIEFIGGAEAWKALETVQLEGKMNMMGTEFPFVSTMGAPDRMRIDLDIMGQKMVQSYDGKTAWHIMPMMGINTPTEMPVAEAEYLKHTQLVPEFIDYAARGYGVELADAREIEGIATQGVLLTDYEGKHNTYYFDLEYFVPIMTETVMTEGPMRGDSIETYFSDYTEVENGLIMPFFTEIRISQGSFQKMTYTKVELNPELESGFFSMTR